MMLTAGIDADDGNSNLLGDDGVGAAGAVDVDADGTGAEASDGAVTGADATGTSPRQDPECSATLASKVRSFRLFATCVLSRSSFNVGQLSALQPRVVST